MNKYFPLSIYFDGSCSLCHNEIQNIKLHDTEGHLILVDCSADHFDETPFLNDGVTREAMMDCLHVRDSRGVWIKGVPAFALIYRSVGLSAVASLWGGRFTRTLMERVYPWIALHRQGLSRTGLPILFELWGKCSAWRAHRRSRQCSEGRCSIKSDERMSS